MQPITKRDIEIYTELQSAIMKRAGYVCGKISEIKYGTQAFNVDRFDSILEVGPNHISFQADDGYGDYTTEDISINDLTSDEFIETLAIAVAKEKEEQLIRSEATRKRFEEQRIERDKELLAQLLKKYPNFTMEDL